MTHDNDHYTARSDPKRARKFIVGMVLSGLLLGMLIGWGMGRAEGAEPEQTAAPTECATQDAGACESPTKKAKRFKRKLSDDTITNGSGFKPKKLFKKPRKAKKVIVKRIARMLAAADAAGSASARTRAVDYEAQARGVYAKMVQDSPCTINWSADTYWNPGARAAPRVPRTCDPNYRNAEKATPRQIVNGIAVTACGVGATVAILTPAGRAAGAALKFWGAFSHVASCMTMAALMGMAD